MTSDNFNQVILSSENNRERIAEASTSSADIRHIPSLDGLRAASILLVFLAHIGLDRYVPGGLGVTIFFFLSGFLITTLMRAEYEKNGVVNLKHFWLRRILRIFPPFYLVLFLAVLVTVLRGKLDVLEWPAMASQFFHYTNYWVIFHSYQGLPPQSGTGVYWSLAVEEHFYLLFPWIYWAMCRAKLTGHAQASILILLCIVALIWRYILVMHFSVTPDRTYMGTDTRVDSILFGCALAVGYNPVLDRLSFREPVWMYLIIPASLALLAFSLLNRNAVFHQTLRYTVQGLALAPLFVAAIQFSQWKLFRPLNWKPVKFLGVLSYSFYLVHYAVIFFITDRAHEAPAYIQAIAAFLLALFISWLIYKLIERPCARIRRRLID